MDYITNYNYVMQFGISDGLQFVSLPSSAYINYSVKTFVLFKL